MKRGLKLFIILSLVLILISTVYAAQFGKGRYNIGSYGQGEEEDQDSGGGAGGPTKTKTTGGSITGSGSSFSLQTPDDLEDSLSSNSDFNCASGTCTVKVKEVIQEGLPNTVAVNVGGTVLGAIQLECNGELGTSTTTFTINAQDGVSCDNINVEKIKDDGTKDEVNNQCQSTDTTLTVTATYSGCSYLILSKTGEEQPQPEVVTPTTPETTGEEQPKPVSLTSDTVPITTDLIGKGGIIIILLALVVLIILIAVIFIIKKKKAQNVQPNTPVTQSYQAYQYQTQTQQVQQPIKQQTFSQQATTNYSKPVAQTQVR